MHIVDQIFDAVKSGAIKPGDSLPPEHQLAQTFNVGRSSVREALSALKLVGIVEGRPGLGTFIRSSSSPSDFLDRAVHLLHLIAEENPLELIEARLCVEPYVVTLAASNRTEEDLKRCDLLLSEMKNDVIGHGYLNRDSELHIVFAEMSQNAILTDMVRGLHGRMEGQSWRTFKLGILDDEERMIRYHEEHVAVFNAIKEQDAERAREIMRLHIEQIREDFLG